MTSSANRIIVSIFSLFFSFFAFGKEINCYILISSTDQDVKMGAIQFISFIGDQCYESDANGVSVKNGTLHKNVYKSSQNIVVYTGTCFCGSGASFEFIEDKNVLIVKSKIRKTYKFKKIEKPNGVFTCSLLRTHNDNENSYDFVNNGCNYPNSSNSTTDYNTNSPNNSQKSNSSTTPKRRCVYCNGTGLITKNENAPTNFGIDRPRKQCSTCGEWYDPDVFNHFHIRCRHCSGTGYAK